MARLAISFPQFRHPPRVTFGRGSTRVLASCDDGRTVFLLGGTSGTRERLAKVLGREGGTLRDENCLTKPPGEPGADSIRAAAMWLREHAPARIVAVGGGSVLDWARLAWAVAADRVDIDAGTVSPAPSTDQPISFWLVPTTCGTGAEAADVVVYSADDGSKRAVVSPVFAADHVILDSALTDSLTGTALAAFVADALSHSLEGYLSIVPNPLARTSAIGALQRIFAAFTAEPGGAARDQLLEASLLGGIAAANCSVGIVHAFAHAVGADGVPHGLGNAVALEAGIAFNREVPAMATLCDALRLDDAEALLAAVHPITTLAASAAPATALARLGDDSYAADVAARMLGDVAIRSNPRRADASDTQAFVATVADWLARQ